MKDKIQVWKCTVRDEYVLVYDPKVQKENRDWVQLFVISKTEILPHHRNTILKNSIDITETDEGNVALKKYKEWKTRPKANILKHKPISRFKTKKQRNVEKKNKQKPKVKRIGLGTKRRKRIKRYMPDTSSPDIRDNIKQYKKCPHGVPFYKICAICQPDKFKDMWG